jgi:hypothetical protein
MGMDNGSDSGRGIGRGIGRGRCAYDTAVFILGNIFFGCDYYPWELLLTLSISD